MPDEPGAVYPQRRGSGTGELGLYHQTRRISIAVAIVLAFMATGVIRSAWGYGGIHETIEAAGFILIAAGILGRMWCVLYIGARKSRELIVGGPYSVSRNPLYLFSTVAAAGVGAQSGSIVVAAFFAVLCAAIFHLVIVAEERFLAELFGDPYEAYCNAVPRFLPDIRLFRDDALLTVRTSILYRTFLDGMVFFVAVPILESVEHLQELHVIPVLLHLP